MELSLSPGDGGGSSREADGGCLQLEEVFTPGQLPRGRCSHLFAPQLFQVHSFCGFLLLPPWSCCFKCCSVTRGPGRETHGSSVHPGGLGLVRGRKGGSGGPHPFQKLPERRLCSGGCQPLLPGTKPQERVVWVLPKHSSLKWGVRLWNRLPRAMMVQTAALPGDFMD